MKDAPEWAKAHKVPGTELRLLGGKYRLYKITSKWNPDKKRAQKVTLNFLGTITEQEGLIRPKVEQIKDSLSEISVLEYGAHALVDALAAEIKAHLERYFPEFWRQIWVAAQMRFIHQSPIKNWAYHYERSYLTQSIPVRLNQKSCGVFLRKLGCDRDRIVRFLRELSGNEDEHILIDTTHVTSESEQIDITKKGYNSSLHFQSQINLLYIFSADKKAPLYYRMLPGNIREISAMRLSVEESGLKNVTLIGDKGFYSKANVEALVAAKLRYILPLRRNNSLVNYSLIESGDKRKLDGHFLFNKRPIWHSKLSTDVTLFLDEHLKLQESTDYLSRINEGCDGYSTEEFHKRQHQFGTIAMSSNIPEISPQDMYLKYKARGAIEQAFDSYKNLLDADTTYMHGTEQMEAWSFINFLALLFYYKAYNALLSANLLDKFSVRDLILRAKEAKKLHILGQWKPAEVSLKTRSLFEKVKAPIT